MNEPRETVTVYFGVFGERDYAISADTDMAVQIPCRWCLGEDEPIGCVACKWTGEMWVGL